jgi:hypothetical protein
VVLHQFERTAGELVPSNVRNTPAWSRVPESAVRQFADANADAIENGAYVLPSAWWAPSSSPHEDVPAYVSGLPQHDDLVRGTCGGCHAESASGFQIDPMASGQAKVSRFLSDPSKPQDELGRRTEWMQIELAKGP